MRILLQRLGLAVGAAGVALGSLAPAAAQNFRTVLDAASSYAPTPSGSAGLSANPRNFAGGFVPPVFATPFVPTNYFNVIPDPYSGYLFGGADLIRAQGDLQIQLQQAKITRQQAEQARLDTRRKAFDQYLYERAERPTSEDERERARLERIRRARNQPPLGEIWSGHALNTLLGAIAKMQAQGAQGPDVPLDPYLLRRINVTTGASAGNFGLLRDGGRLTWPVALRAAEYAKPRAQLDQLAAVAYKQASQGMVESDTVTEMNALVRKLRAELRRNVRNVSFNDHLQATRFLNELSRSVRALDDPNVRNFVNGKWSARGDTVSELVRTMTGKGLRFAPATQGDESAYTALHSALVAYYQPAGPDRPWDPAAK
jgi:hypothetical protein